MDRRLRLALGGVAALVLAGALVAPVVIGSGGGSSPSCAATLYYSGRPYTVRATTGPAAVQDLAIGVGVVSGCEAKPENVDVRSLSGIPAARAIGLSGGSAVWVRRGICAHASSAALLSCLKR